MKPAVKMKKQSTMRKLPSIISLAMLMAIISCEGPIGPEGPQGQQGPQGAPGVNIVAEVFQENVDFVAEDDFEVIFEFNPVIEEGDVLLVYIRWETDGGTSIWRALPQTVFFEQGVLMYNFDFTRSDFRLFLDGPLDYSLLGPEWTQDQTFRVVIVPGDFSGSRIDWTNYDAVTKMLGISDADFQISKLKIKN